MYQVPSGNWPQSCTSTMLRCLIAAAALRNYGVSEGANRLGIHHSALSRWAQRRHLPT